MSAPHSEHTEPRIIKKKKVGGGHHGGAWKVAYADFVTAMMALFIVLWIMSQSQSVRQAVAQYFKNPGVLSGSTGLMETSDMSGPMPTPGHSQELQTPSPITPDVKEDKAALEEVKKRIQEIIAQLPELNKLKDQVLLEVTPEGLRIELLERENSAFFDVGSADLKPETRKMLGLIAAELGRLPNRVAIEGHTDSRPYGKANYSNWELAADRANAARRLMDGGGLRPDQITAVRGYADRMLRNPKDPLDYQNRRVSIIVLHKEKDKTLKQALNPIPAEAGGKQEPPALPAPKAVEAGGNRPETPQVSIAKPAESAEVRPASPPAPSAKPADPGGQASPVKDDGPAGQVQAEVKKLFEPFKPQERLGW